MGGLKGLDPRDGEPEADEVDWARGPVGMLPPLALLLLPLGPADGIVGEPA